MTRVTRRNPLATVSDVGAVNPCKFGAIGDGSHDDTVALQAAIDAAPITPYGIAVVQVPDGHYVIKSALVPKSNLIIQGAGNNTVLDFSNPTSATDNLFNVSSGAITDLTFRNLQLIGNGRDSGDGSAQGVGIRLSCSTLTRLSVEGCTFTNFRYGIRLAGSTLIDSPGIRGNRFYGCSYAGLSATNTASAKVTDNWVDATRTGVGDAAAGVVGLWCGELASGSLGHLDTVVSNNHVKGTYAEGINVHAKYATITGNSVRDCAVGVMLEPFITTSPGADDVKLVSTIAGNVCRNNTIGIVVRNDPVNNTRSVCRVAITGNACQGGTDGIRVGMAGDSSGVSMDVTVTGNVCFDQSTTGIIVYNAQRVALDGNVVNAQLAVFITGTARGVSLSGGSYSGVDCALSIDSNAKLVSVVGGCYTATGTGGSEDAIRVAGSYVTISAATVDNVQRSGIRVTGTAHDVAIHGLLALDDQGSPTMDSAVHVSSSGANITVDGHSIVSGAAAKFTGSVKSVNGIGSESANAENPTAANWNIGDHVFFTDSGDGSGNGIYVLGLDGSTWTKLAQAISGVLTNPVISTIKDANGNTILDMSAPTASAVNFLRAGNSIAGSSVPLSAAGSDTNININLITKGTGKVFVNGVQVATLTGTETITNKRVTPRVTVTATPGGTTLSPDASNNDMHGYSALTKAITINAPSGTPTDYQPMGYRFKDDGTGRALTWDPIFRAIGVTLPTTTTANKTLHVFTRYNSADSKWDVIDVKQEA